MSEPTKHTCRSCKYAHYSGCIAHGHIETNWVTGVSSQRYGDQRQHNGWGQCGLWKRDYSRYVALVIFVAIMLGLFSLPFLL